MRKIIVVLSIMSYIFLANHCAAQILLEPHGISRHAGLEQKQTEKKCCHGDQEKTTEQKTSHSCGSNILCCNKLAALLPESCFFEAPSSNAADFLLVNAPFLLEQPSIVVACMDHGPPGFQTQNEFFPSLNSRAPPFSS